MLQPKKKARLPKKSKRERWRYILFEAEFPDTIDGKALWIAVRDSFSSAFGADGMAKVNPRLVKFWPGKNKGILRCSRGTERLAAKALGGVERVQGKPVKLRSLRCSGSVKALRQSI